MVTQRDFAGPTETRFSLIRIVSETGSTNKDLLDEAAQGAAEGQVLVTDHQTAGRGRQGRSWFDEPGASLLTSVLLRPPATWAPLIPLLTGLAITRAVRAETGLEVGLKWPNDVLAKDERKLAGILAEARTGIDGMTVVVGFGLNLRWSVGAPPEVASRAVDLASLTSSPPERLSLLASILVEMEARLRQLQAGDRAALLDDYRTVCISLGRRVRLETPGGDVVGQAIAIDESGHLVIAKDDGTQVTVTAGDAHHLP
jgi:BirA family biotin operon repressor/biotin-[acetyl-CoA-carboxylase] ligase